jgi:hypothetical protein
MYRRLIHASEEVVRKACYRVGIMLTAKTDTFCEPYTKGKIIDVLGKRALVEASSPLDFIRVDVVIYKDALYLGYCYSLYIIDVWSNYQWVKFT